MENKKSFSTLWLIVILGLSIYVASKWETPLSFIESEKSIKEIVNSLLNPVFGKLINFNIYLGFVIIVAVISFFLTLSQKVFSDQKELKEIRKQQKYLQEEMKKYKDDPKKILEFQKKQLEFFPKTFELTMKPLLYTSIPVILLFKWFGDNFYPEFGNWWILWYIVIAMFFSGIFRKLLDVA